MHATIRSTRIKNTLEASTALHPHAGAEQSNGVPNGQMEDCTHPEKRFHFRIRLDVDAVQVHDADLFDFVRVRIDV